MTFKVLSNPRFHNSMFGCLFYSEGVNDWQKQRLSSKRNLNVNFLLLQIFNLQLLKKKKKERRRRRKGRKRRRKRSAQARSLLECPSNSGSILCYAKTQVWYFPSDFTAEYVGQLTHTPTNSFAHKWHNLDPGNRFTLPSVLYFGASTFHHTVCICYWANNMV